MNPALLPLVVAVPFVTATIAALVPRPWLRRTLALAVPIGVGALGVALVIETSDGSVVAFTAVDECEADVVVFNTCSVRQHAEERVLSRLGALKDRKARVVRNPHTGEPIQVKALSTRTRSPSMPIRGRS